MKTTYHCRHLPGNAKACVPPLPSAIAIEFHLVIKQLAGTSLARYASRPRMLRGVLPPKEDQ